MRKSTIALALSCVFVGGLAAQAIAGGHSEANDRTRWRLEDRVSVLEMEVADLRAGNLELMAAFQASLTDRADRLERVARDSRREGFTSGAISTKSRITLLDGVEEFARALRVALPAMSDEAKARQAAIALAERHARSRMVARPAPPAKHSPGAGTMPRATEDGEHVKEGTPSEGDAEDK